MVSGRSRSLAITTTMSITGFAESPGTAVAPTRVGLTTITRLMEPATHTPWVVLVEGLSDKAAVEALAQRHGRNLAAEGVEIVSIGGAHAIGRFIGDLPPAAQLAGLCDLGEVQAFGRALDRVGIGPAATPSDLEALGFFVCKPDLEGELIRALGAAVVEAVLEQSGKLSSFRTFQKQPQWHGRPVEAQLRRFFGSSAGKIRHAPLMVEALDLDRVPRPLASLLAYVGATRLPRG